MWNTYLCVMVYIIIGVVIGITGTLFFQKYVLKTFDKVKTAVADVKKDL